MNEINEPDNPNHCLEEPITQEENLKKYTMEVRKELMLTELVWLLVLAAWTTLQTLTRCWTGLFVIIRHNNESSRCSIIP